MGTAGLPPGTRHCTGCCDGSRGQGDPRASKQQRLVCKGEGVCACVCVCVRERERERECVCCGEGTDCKDARKA
jgi:hypothetical protein